MTGMYRQLTGSTKKAAAETAAMQAATAAANERANAMTPKTPTIDAARQQLVDSDRLRRRTGRGATMLTGAAGDTGGATGSKMLLGS